MLKMTNAGEEAALSTFVNKTPPQNLRLHLYTNDAVLKDDMVVSDLTEASYPGYLSTVLSGGLWAIVGVSPSKAIYPVVTFVCTGPVATQTVYGYYVTREGSGDLMWAEALPTPQKISAAGENIALAPSLTARDESD